MHGFLHLNIDDATEVRITRDGVATRISVRGPHPGASSVTIEVPAGVALVDERTEESPCGPPAPAPSNADRALAFIRERGPLARTASSVIGQVARAVDCTPERARLVLLGLERDGLIGLERAGARSFERAWVSEPGASG